MVLPFLLPLFLGLVDSPPRNCLLITIDDVGNDAIGVYEEGDPDLQPRTPRMDAFAKKGTRFVNCYSNPSCSPTRATLLTGRYAYRTGIGTIIGHDSDASLSRSEWTLAEALQEQGYATVLLGKWHLGGDNDPFREPFEHGFDSFAATRGNIQRYSKAKVWVGSQGKVTVERSEYLTTRVAEDILSRLSTLPEPWFVFANFHAAHRPLHDPPTHLHSVENPETRRDRFAAVLEALDTELGRVFEAVNLETTYVFLMGDNGTDEENASVAGRGFKSTLYEGGINVPFLAAGPTVPSGKVSDALVHSVDFYATIWSLLAPDQKLPSRACDSLSFREALEGTGPGKRKFVFAEEFLPLSGPPYKSFKRMARNQRYKLIRDQVSTQGPEFFDLEGTRGFDGPIRVPKTPAEKQAFRELSKHLDAIPDPVRVPPREDPER